ncbi:MAG: hypothetical protein CMF56_06535 [Leifsonia sp.]|nr:hypothetical protein [Leifsonia sp.]
MDSSEVTAELVVRAGLEFIFVLGVFVAILIFSRLRQRLFPLGAAALTVLFLFLAAWGGAQMLDRWQYDYPQKLSAVPLTRFAMYQVQIPESVESTYGWEATLTDGSIEQVNIASEFEAIGLPPLSTRMRVLLSWTAEPAGSEDELRAREELRLYAVGLERALAARGIDVARMDFLRVTGTPLEPESELILSWDADDLRSTR